MRNCRRRRSLHGQIDQEIWVKPPEGMGIAKGMYCRLLKSLYGLKQAPRIWQKMLSEVFIGLSFKQLRTDSAVYILRYPEDKGTPTIIITHVDDIAIYGSRLRINWVKKELSRKFEMQDLGPISFYLGMKIERDRARRRLVLSQRAFAEKITKEFLGTHGPSQHRWIMEPS
jgi:hypothetical protein